MMNCFDFNEFFTVFLQDIFWDLLSNSTNTKFLKAVPSSILHTLHPYQMQTEPHDFYPVTKFLTEKESIKLIEIYFCWREAEVRTNSVFRLGEIIEATSRHILQETWQVSVISHVKCHTLV